MPGFYRSYVDGRWGQIHLRIAPGSHNAHPLLMLHQTPKSGWIWEPLFAQLSPARTLIAPDTPGYGASDGPARPVEIEDYAAEMLALIDRLALDGVVPDGAFDVIGYHTGSLTAAALATLAPDRVRRVVLVSLGAFTAEERAARLAALPAAPTLAADGSHLVAMWNMIDGFTDPRASLAWKQASLTENQRSGAGFYKGYGAVFRHDLFAKLAAIEQPVLVLNPQDDLWHETHRAMPSIPNGRMVELRGVGHGLFDLEPARIGGLVGDFLR